MYLPTTKAGMESAIGHYIHDIVAAKIAAEAAASAAAQAAPGYVAEPYTWAKASVPKEHRTDAQIFADYCAAIRARKVA